MFGENRTFHGSANGANTIGKLIFGSLTILFWPISPAATLSTPLPVLKE